MPFLRNNQPPAGNNDSFKYAFILEKLLRTIHAYRSKYPELVQLHNYIESLNLDEFHINPQVNKLATIADYMAVMAVDSYVIRHIHHNFNNDIRNLQEGSNLNDHLDLYLESGLPGAKE
ncbi:hypothetical protein PKOR_20140 [Pontibacter korlensis]|uniref:Uncharacterized protein n=1 Tax=Pontibacter korlensis TaxID=400092 RepID=A0A0E3ZGG7_9BACT|nr:hypothetical protein [Pontibacter korlensis]AKD04975.1 hypothetical protein PKOR_20140 [Pontibacter korlensis]